MNPRGLLAVVILLPGQRPVILIPELAFVQTNQILWKSQIPREEFDLNFFVVEPTSVVLSFGKPHPSLH